jgi:hypothetical protein
MTWYKAIATGRVRFAEFLGTGPFLVDTDELHSNLCGRTQGI